MVKASKGDLVRLEFTGKLSSTGQIIETTDEELARKVGIHEEGMTYGVKLAAFGQNTIMKGMEEAVIASQLGKRQDFLIEPENAFGKKQPELIRMLPLREFSKHNLSPVPGMAITLDGIGAIVKSVTSGRVVVDFNHPLAGERVLYSIKVHEIITEPQKKIEAVLASFGLKGSVVKNGDKLSVEFEKGSDGKKAEAAKSAIKTLVPNAAFA